MLNFSRLKTGLFALCALVTVLASPSAYANIGEAFGFGSRTQALGGAGAAWGFDGYAAYANPAGLPLMGEKRLVLSYGIMDAEVRFTPINNIVVSNNYNSNEVLRRNVDLNYRSTFGNQLGLAYQLFPEFHHLTVGLTTFVPISQLAYIDTGETFVPEYFLYRARTLRPQFEFGAGMETWPGLFAGFGLHMAYSMTSSADPLISTKNTSTMRFSASLKPKLAPYFGLLFAPGYDPKQIQGINQAPDVPFTAGLVVRAPVASENAMALNTGARFLGEKIILDFNLKANSALYYDPWSIELGTSFEWLQKRMRTYLQLEAQLWSHFEAPMINMQDLSITNGTIPVKASQNPYFSYRDILVPRIGNEWAVADTVALRVGYAFRPSILTGLSTGTGNYLDPPKHQINAGVGLKFSKFLGLAVPCSVDINALYQQLVTQQITKTPGNEGGDLSDPKVGSPGYEAGGKVFGGGASFTLAF